MRPESLQEDSSFYDQPPYHSPHQPAVSHGTKRIRMMQTDSTRHTIDYWIYIHHHVCVSVRPFGALLEMQTSATMISVCAKALKYMSSLSSGTGHTHRILLDGSFSLDKKLVITANMADGYEA